MTQLENLEPSRVFYYFRKICGIPHGSGNVEAISDYLVAFAKEHNLEYVQDEMKNVLIRKKAAPGYENAPSVMLQGHMDMVCEKRPDVEFDFEKDGLRLGVEDGFLHANGTTLGGDDGIAVAYGLAVLEDNTLAHPELEVLFTVDEEIGLLGAAGFDCSQIKSRRLINLDSEAEGILWSGCAGGMTAYSHIPVQFVEKEGTRVTITLSGLKGGHSGAEIHKGRANATLALARLLFELKEQSDFSLAEISGGEKDNAIPRNATAVILANADEVEAIKAYAAKFEHNLSREYEGIEDGIKVTVTAEGELSMDVLHPSSLARVLFFLGNIPFGVQKMSGMIEGLVETSMNPGIVRLDYDELLVTSSIRSSIGSAKEALASKVQFLAEFLGGEFEIKGAYPAWEYRADSPLRDCMRRVFVEQYHKEPEIAAIHAGLECGLFYEQLDNLDAISIGPDMKDIHTSEEKLDIASTERVWKYLLGVLKALNA